MRRRRPRQRRTNDGSRSYSFDADNRMTGAGTFTFGHDPAGRMHHLQTANTSEFIYDGAEVIGEYISGGFPFRRFVRGPGADEAVAWYDGAGSIASPGGRDIWHLFSDERGSIVLTRGADRWGSLRHLGFNPCWRNLRKRLRV